MATIIVGVIAAAAGPFTGGASVAVFAATMAAAYVDATYVLPRLAEEAQPPQLEDLQIQTSSVGAPKTISYGTQTRFNGQVIWLSDIFHEQHSGGGGGKSGEVVTRDHYAHVNIGVCEREISKVDLLHVDGEMIYDSVPTFSASGTYDHGTPQVRGKLQFWYTPQTELDGSVFVPFRETVAAIGRRLESLRGDLIVSSDPRAPSTGLGSGVDFAEVHVGKSLRITGGVFGAAPNIPLFYTVASQGRGLSGSVAAAGQSILRLEIASATDSIGTVLRPSLGSAQSWARCLPNEQSPLSITGVTTVPATGLPVNMSVTVGAGHGVAVAAGRWLHFDTIWEDLHISKTLITEMVATNYGRGLGGGPFWAVATSATVLDLYTPDKTTRVTCRGQYLVSPPFTGPVKGYFIFEDTSAVTYSFDQSEVLGVRPTEKWKPGVTDTTAAEFFTGPDNQLSRPAIVASLEGLDNLPMRKRNAHFALSRLALGNFGNRLPSFSVTVTREGALLDSYGDALLDIADRCGFDAGQVTAEGDVATDELTGYVIQGITDGQRAIQPLAIAGDIVAVEDGDGTQGIVRFYKRLEAPTYNIDMGAVGAMQTGEDPRGLLKFAEVSDIAMPKQIWVKFQDTENQLQANQVGYQKADDVTVGTNIPRTTDRVSTLNLPMSLSPNEAQGIAARLFQLAYLQRKTVEFTLSPKYHWVRANYRLILVYQEEVFVVRTTRATLGVNMITEIEAVVESIEDVAGGGDAPPIPTGIEAFGYVSPASNSPAQGGEPQNRVPTASPLVVLQALDLPALSEDVTRQVGVYYAASLRTEFGASSSYVLFRRRADVGAFQPVPGRRSFDALGFARDGSFGSGLPDVWDLASELVVEVSSGPDLVSVTETEALAGVNMAVVGDELIVYQNATLLRVEFDARIYKLTTFRRGIADTTIEDFTNGQRFVPLPRAGSAGSEPHSLSDIGSEWEYKAVPPGYAESDISATRLLVTGRTVKPRAPAHVAATYNAVTGDVVFSWVRKTRSPWPTFAPTRLPYEEPFIGFRVVITDTSDDTEVRRFEPVDSTPAMGAELQSVTYTAAMQTADGLLGLEVLAVSVAQVSDMVGDGFATEISWTVPEVE